MSCLYGCQDLNRTMETICECETEPLTFQYPGPIISQFLHLAIIVHIFVSYLDAHMVVPLTISRGQLQASTLADLKKSIIPYLKKYAACLGFDILLDSYHFFSVGEGSIIYLQDELLAETLFKTGIKILRFQDNISYWGRSPIKPQNKRKNELLEVLKTQRNAYLLPKNRILTRGKLSILSTPAQKLTTQMVLMTNEVNCLSDKELSESIIQTHRHQNVYGSIVKLQYSKNNQRKTVELYQNNIVLYSKENPPFAYQKATAGQISAEFDSGQDVYIFDSHNNYHKVTRAELTAPKLHTFYSISTSSKESEKMIIIDDIRVLNSIFLGEASQMVVLRQNCKRLYADILYVFNEEMNYEQYTKYDIAINRYVQKLAYKSQEGLDIYLSHNIPSIKAEVNQPTQNGFYKEWFEFTIQADKVMSISQNKLTENSVIYFQQAVKARDSMLFSYDKNFLNFRAKTSHYLPSNGSQKEILLPEKSFYFINAIQSANIYEIIELQAPQAQADMYILWIDDHPKNNISLQSEIKSSANMKIGISHAISVKHAVSWIKTFYLYIRWMWPNKPIKMIADMQLNGSQEAGADLIQQIGRLGLQIPIMFFVSTANALEILQRRNLISQHIGITAQRTELLTWCISSN